MQLWGHRSLSVSKTYSAVETTECRQPAEPLSREQKHKHSQTCCRYTTNVPLVATLPAWCWNLGNKKEHMIVDMHINHICSSYLVFSTNSSWGVPPWVYPLWHWRPCGKMAEWTAVFGLPECPTHHFWLPFAPDMWTVSSDNSAKPVLLNL